MIVYERSGWRVDRMVVGELMVNCYLVIWTASGDAIVVDPGDEADRIARQMRELSRGSIRLIVNTHGHGDHIGGNQTLAKLTGAPLAIGRSDAPMLSDSWLNLSTPFGLTVTSPPAQRLLGEGDEIRVGEGRLRVLDTPGHTIGGITLAGDGFALVGDLLFQGSIGRTDFAGGSFETLMKMIVEKIYPLGDHCVVLPGHGDPTTVGEERRTNPFLQMGAWSRAY